MRTYGFGLIGTLVLMGGCGGTQEAVQDVPQAMKGRLCELEKVGPSPFKNPDATHLLVADFYGGVGCSGPDFSQAVTEQVSAELKRFRDETLRDPKQFNVEVPEGSLEIHRLSCFVQDHEQADAISKKQEADVMIWGQAYCNPMVYAEMHQRKPFTICPKVTLTRSKRSFRRSTEQGMDLASLWHLDLPALMATEAFGLVEFALGTHFYERKNYWLAARFYKRSADKVLAGESNVWTLHMMLGFVYLYLPDWELSLQHSRLALEQVRGTGSAEEGTVLNNIGHALLAQGKPDEALECHRKALAIDEKALGAEHPDVSRDLSNAGNVLRVLGRLEEALEHHRKALAIDVKVLGAEHPDVGRDLGNIGNVLRALGRLEEALEHYRKALAIDVKVLGAEHPDIGRDLSNIGHVLYDQGKLNEALKYHRGALAIDVKMLGDEHPDVGRDLGNIGNVLRALGRLEEALEHYRRALAIDEKALGDEPLDVGRDLRNIGHVLYDQGKLNEALVYHRKAFTIDEKALGVGHPDVGRDLGNIANVLQALGRLEEALEHYRKALTIDEKALGTEHPYVGGDLSNIGRVLYDQGKLNEALEHHRRALAIDEKALGPGHPNMGWDLSNIGKVLQAQSKLGEALGHFRKALAIDEKALGPGHPDVGRDLNNIAIVLNAQGNLNEALMHYSKALAIYEKKYGSQHRATHAIRRNLAIILARQNGWDPDPRHNPNQRGAVVLNCLENTCEFLKPGDWLKAYQNTPIRNAAHLGKLTQKTNPSQTIALTLIRNTKPLILHVLGGRLGAEIR